MAKLGREARKRRGRKPKMEAVDELNRLFQEGDGIVFVDNKGLSVEKMNELRSQLRAAGVRVKVAKNTLIRRSLSESEIDSTGIEDILKGPTMMAVGLEDAVSPSKKIYAFLEENEGKLEIKGGLLEKKFLDVAGVEQLSKLPSREDLMVKMLNSLSAPAQNTCYAINAAVSQIAWVLSARQRQLEEQGG